MGSLASAQDGSFTAFGSSQPQYNLLWNGDGFSGLPFTQFDGSRDRYFIPYLPPMDNLVQNSGFEDGLLGWNAGGTLPPVAPIDLPHTGNTSVFLGTPTMFGPMVEFSDLADWTHLGGFIGDRFGGVHLLCHPRQHRCLVSH